MPERHAVEASHRAAVPLPRSIVRPLSAALALAPTSNQVLGDPILDDTAQGTTVPSQGRRPPAHPDAT